jgi:hypothetical protein
MSSGFPMKGLLSRELIIGLSEKQFPLHKLPGMTKKSGFSIGYRLNGQIICNKAIIENAHPMKVGDVIGCGINYIQGHLFFTHNSQLFGIFIRDQSHQFAVCQFLSYDWNPRQELHDHVQLWQAAVHLRCELTETENREPDDEVGL